jgi:hypothetical protein
MVAETHAIVKEETKNTTREKKGTQNMYVFITRIVG